MGLNRRRPFFILMFTFLSIGVSAQVTFDSKEELLAAANQAFDRGDYAKAKPLFSQLLSQDALDPNYNYRFGVCMLVTEDDVVKPLPFIEGGANSPGVNNEAFYYLGKAYHLNFRFDEAIEAFQKAKGKSVTINGVDIDKEIQACRNGKVLYDPSLKFNPVSEKEAIESEFFRPYNFRKLKGKVIPMPPNFKTKYDEKNLKSAFVYTPTITQVLFYASYGEDGSTGKDIYRVRRLPTGDWALPVRLPSQINTDLDEDHAFFDEISQTLYFSSNGHNSMGGLDIFSSKYEASNDSWSAPINLQYPYNSPFDDFLYVNDPDNTVAFFSSRRASELGKVRVFQNSLVDQSTPELSIITGHYSEEFDSTATKMKARLKGTDGLVGEYRSNDKGNYVIMAPPMQGYKLSIAPRDKEAFDFDLDIPKHYKFNPLEQKAQYKGDETGGEVALTNYFNDQGKGDSLVVVERKTAGELPELVLSAKQSESQQKDEQILAAIEQGKEEARKEIEELERKVREQAKQDSIAAVAAAEIEKSEQLAAAQAEEQARLDSIAIANELAAVEAPRIAEQKKIEEEKRQLELAKEKALEDSIRVAEEEATRLALEAQLEETTRKQSEIDASLAAEKTEQARLDSARAVEEEAARLALAQQQKVEAEREERLRDSLRIAQQVAEEEVRKALEAEQLALREKQLADSLAQARKTEELAAREQARLDSIDAEVEQLKLAALEEAKRNEELISEAPSEQQRAAEIAAEQENQESEAAVALANANAEAEAESTTDSEVQQAQEAAQTESQTESQTEVIKEMISEETAANQELNELNLQVAERTAKLAADTSSEISRDEQIAVLNERIEELEKQKAIRDVERQIDLLEERMEAQKEIEQLAKTEQERLTGLKEEEKDKQVALEKGQAEESELLEQIRQIESEQNTVEQKTPEELAVAEEAEDQSVDLVDIADSDELESSKPTHEPGEYIVDGEIDLAERSTETGEVDNRTEQESQDELGVDIEVAEEVAISKEQEESKTESEQATSENTVQESVEVATEPEGVAEPKEPEAVVQTQEVPVLEEDMSDADLFIETLKNLEGNMVKEPEQVAELEESETQDTDSPVEELAATEERTEASVMEQSETAVDETPVETAEVPVGEPMVIAPEMESGIEEEEETREAEQLQEVAQEELQEVTETAKSTDPEVEGGIEQEPVVETTPEEEEAPAAEVEETIVVEETVQETSVEVAENTQQEVSVVAETAEDPALAESMDADRKALLEHQKRAAEKEAELRAKLEADKAALGISSSERQEETETEKARAAEFQAVHEMLETEPEAVISEQTAAEIVKKEAQPDQRKSAADEFLETIKQLEEGQEKPEVAEAPAELQPVEEKTDQVVAESTKPEEVSETVQVVEEKAQVVFEENPIDPEPMSDTEAIAEEPEPVANQAVEDVESLSIGAEAATITEEPEEVSGDYHPMASRVFKIKPALRDYSLVKFDPNTVEDRKARRLLQRMNAEDRGRLSVLKNIHNRALDANGDELKLAAVSNDDRNSEVLASMTRVAREAPPMPTVNWTDRRRRADVTYRLAFEFKPKKVSDRIRENMDPASEANFHVPQVSWETGRFLTLADARSAQLEYRSRGMGEPAVKAYHKGEPIGLLTAIERPVVE